MITKEFVKEKYLEYKRNNDGRIPKRDEFLTYAACTASDLEGLFGGKPYSKLQVECGDEANQQWGSERTPLEKIMQQYADLVAEMREVPVGADWDHRKLKPTTHGLFTGPFKIKWSQFPERFVEWVATTKSQGYADVLKIIQSKKKEKNPPQRQTSKCTNIIDAVMRWSPARRRNSEGEYKIELRKHLESLRFSLNEEHGESIFDLLVNGVCGIEIKKDPNQSEYDRLFGQLARHLQYADFIIALILDVGSQDKYDQFTVLVDRYLNNGDEHKIEIIKK